MERSGKRYSGKPDGGAKRSRNAQRKKTTSQQDYMTTSCWDDVVFTEKTFRVVSWNLQNRRFDKLSDLSLGSTDNRLRVRCLSLSKAQLSALRQAQRPHTQGLLTVVRCPLTLAPLKRTTTTLSVSPKKTILLVPASIISLLWR